MELPLREQGVLLTGVRGCDLTPKFPLDSPERQLTGWMRYAILNPADSREVGIKGAFFQTEFPKFRWSEFGHYPLHWVIHAIHCLQVIGYRHPDTTISFPANCGYLEAVHSLHMRPEPMNLMISRLSEDRIAKGEVVS